MKSDLLDYSVVVLVTYGNPRQVLLVKEGLDDWMLPQGRKLLEETDKTQTVKRVVDLRTGVWVTEDQMHFLGIEEVPVPGGEGEIELATHPVLIIQVTIDIDQYLFRRPWESGEEPESFHYTHALEMRDLLSKDSYLLTKYQPKLMADLDEVGADA